MRLVKVKAPSGLGNEIMSTAFSVGIESVSFHQVEKHTTKGKTETQDVVDIETSTPNANRFIDRLLAADYFDRERFSFNVREPRSVLTSTDMSSLTVPLEVPPSDLFEELWQPRRIVEIGAGFSTKVIRDALAAGGFPCEHRVFDPFADVEGAERVAAEDIDATVFASLRAGDVLFIDTTHTVRPGGDVVRLVLEVLPALADGVVVQLHDFFRPFEYPRFFMEEHGLFWQEQYLVQALLADSSRFEVLLANHALGRLRRDRLALLIPGLPKVPPGSALWLRVRRS
jgi:hypothetical protein